MGSTLQRMGAACNGAAAASVAAGRAHWSIRGLVLRAPSAQLARVTTVEDAPRRVLILFAHPAFGKSHVHRQLVQAVQGLAGVTFHDLYEAYPDYDIDVPREQALLTAHDVLVLQHPFYWYSVPPLVKQWFDLVLEHGWAYGSAGTALSGKICQSAVTAGGREAGYGAGSFNRYTIPEFLAPVEATACLCRMEWATPFIVAGTHAITDEGIRQAAQDYASLVRSYVDGAVTGAQGAA